MMNQDLLGKGCVRDLLGKPWPFLSPDEVGGI